MRPAINTTSEKGPGETNLERESFHKCVQGNLSGVIICRQRPTSYLGTVSLSLVCATYLGSLGLYSSGRLQCQCKFRRDGRSLRYRILTCKTFGGAAAGAGIFYQDDDTRNRSSRLPNEIGRMNQVSEMIGAKTAAEDVPTSDMMELVPSPVYTGLGLC